MRDYQERQPGEGHWGETGRALERGDWEGIRERSSRVLEGGALEQSLEEGRESPFGIGPCAVALQVWNSGGKCSK